MRQLSRKIFLRSALALAVVSTALTGCGQSETAVEEEAAPQTTVFYLVRHAEKQLEGDDPELSEDGYARANALANVLRDVAFDGIYSTDTRRTRDTAAPLVALSNLDVSLYDGRALDLFAQELSNVEGHYLIVGHSNTTPELVNALGGRGGAPIVEADEYDRLYVVTRNGGVVETELRRYP